MAEKLLINYVLEYSLFAVFFPFFKAFECIKDEITCLLSSEHTLCFSKGSVGILQRWQARKSTGFPFYNSQRNRTVMCVWRLKEIILQRPYYLKQVFLLAQMLFHFLVQLFQSFLKFFRRVLFDTLSQFLFAKCQLISNFILLDSGCNALLDSLKKDLQHQEYSHGTTVVEGASRNT